MHTPCSTTPAGPTRQAIRRNRHGPRCIHDEGSHDKRAFRGSITRPLHSLSTLRQVPRDTRRKTRFPLLATLRGGICLPAGLQRRVSDLLLTSHPPFPSLPGARTQLEWHCRKPRFWKSGEDGKAPILPSSAYSSHRQCHSGRSSFLTGLIPAKKMRTQLEWHGPDPLSFGGRQVLRFDRRGLLHGGMPPMTCGFAHSPVYRKAGFPSDARSSRPTARRSGCTFGTTH